MATKNQNRLPERNEIEDLYKWNLEDLFETDALWERAFSQVEKDLKKVPKFKGKLMQGKGEKLLDALEFQYALSLAFERVYVYARMRRDEDNGNAFYQNLAARSEMLGTKLMTAWSFFDPEVLAGAEKMDMFLQMTPGLENYRFLLEDLLRQKAHVLSDQEEALLAGAADALQTGDNVFTMFDNAKSIKRYLPPNGMDAIVLLRTSSGTFSSCKFVKITPIAVLAITSPLLIP